MRRALGLMVLFANCALLHGLGLAGPDSFSALRTLEPPLRITWTMDATTVRVLGGSHELPEEIGAAVFRRLKAQGVPMKDGAFDPGRECFVSLDLWARGADQADNPMDPQRVFNFQMQVYVPAAALKGSGGGKGRVAVWERGVYGICAREAAHAEVRTFLGLCQDFSKDWKRARSPAAPHPAAKTSPTLPGL